MTNCNNLLRRVTAILMCVCLLMGNVSIAVSDTRYSVTSDPVTFGLTSRSGSAAEKVALGNYANLSANLWADRNGTPLPEAVGNDQSLFFQMAFDLNKAEGSDEYLLRQAYQNGLVDADTVFTCDISFLPHLVNTNFPTSYDSEDNIASDGDVNVFRWWIDQSTNQICLRFFENVYTGHGSVSNTKVAFDGKLNISGKDEDGILNFGVDKNTISLLTKQGYAVSKKAGIPYYSAQEGAYLVKYTVTLTLDQNMKLSADVAGDLYSAALSLEDTVLSGGALTGVMVGTPAITAPEGEEAAITNQNNGMANTMSITSPDGLLGKGTYTVEYTMKIDSAAANAKLENYTEAQKTNTVEVKEDGASLATPLTATATIGWKDVTSGQYKIDKLAFADPAGKYDGIYLDASTKKYYIDFRVVVYLKDEVENFTVTDKADYGVFFRAPDDKAVTLQGMCDDLGYWEGDSSAHLLTPMEDVIVTNTINASATECYITVSAPEGQTLKPGAYHLRVPADVTDAVAKTIKNTYPQSYQNTATLTSVDGVPTSESDSFKQAIPIYQYITKVGGYEIDPDTGGFVLTADGRPIIRWDVYFGWEFYNTAFVEDIMDNQELYVNSTYPFDVHHMEYTGNGMQWVNTYASLTSTEDTDYIHFLRDDKQAAIGFTLDTAELIPPEANAEVYKLVYFTVPKLTDNPNEPYYTTGLKNHFDVTFTPPYNHDDGFGITPIVTEPTVAERVSLKLQKEMLYDENDTHNRWRVRVNNTQHTVPIANLTQLIISDRLGVQENYGVFGSDVTIDYDKPITVKMQYFRDNDTHRNTVVTLQEGVHYTIEKQNDANKPSWWDPAWGDWYLGYLNLGPESQYGFGVNINIEAVKELLAADNCTYFRYIDVEYSSENPVLDGNAGYDILNRGYLDYEYLSIPQRLQADKTYNRKFSTKKKYAPIYGDYYDATRGVGGFTLHTVNDANHQGVGYATKGMYDDNPANGDGKEEILWKIFIGAREFENSTQPITVTITDTLSDNMTFPTYEGIELKDLFLIEATKARGHVLVPDSVVLDGQTFTLTFTVPAGAWAGGATYSSSDVEITYHTVLKPEAIADAMNNANGAEQVTINYSNTASVSWNGDTYTLPTSSGSHVFSTVMVDKASTLVTAVSEIEYNIEINEHGLLLNGGEPLELTDELGVGKEGFLYRSDSVRLVNMDTGAALAMSGDVSENTYTLSWAQGDTKGFTICVPDGQRLMLTYRVKPTAAVGEMAPELANSASLNGKTHQHTQSSFEVSATNQEATYTPPEGTASVSVLKLEGGVSIRVVLSGATFEAYPVNADGTLGDAEQVMTTGSDGRTRFDFIMNGDAGYDTVYCIKETSAPAGYQGDDSEWYFYFTLEDGVYANSQVQTIVENLLTNGKNVQQVATESNFQLTVENMPIVCDLRIYKQSADGASLPGASFTLAGEDGSVVPGPVETTADGTTYYTYSNLKSGNYVLTETRAPAGYKLAQVNQWPVTLDAASKTVTINWADGASAEAMGYISADSTGDVPALTVLNDKADNATLSLPVTKILSGVDSTETAFTFALTAVTEGAPMPVTASVSTEGREYTDNQTTLAFPPISYSYEQVGQEFVYTVSENAISESTGFLSSSEVYQVTVQVLWENDAVVARIKSITKADEAADAVAFTNTYVPTTSISGTKVWSDNADNDGLRPDSVVINLLANNEPALDAVGNPIIATVTGTGDRWSFTFEDLPKFADGQEIVYTISENAVAGYTASYDQDTFTVTNSHTPEVTTATVKKVWSDAENQDGKRPESLAVTLSNGTVVTLNEANSWEATVENLPKYEGGQLISYTWTEAALPEGYTMTSNETVGTVTTITNSHTPEVTTATVKKVWSDAENQDGKRPESLSVTLSNSTVVTLNEENSWEATVENLPKYAGGQLISYTWTEAALPEGYTMTSNTTVGTVTTITNSHTPEETTATVKKVWNDAENQDGKRPESLAVTLSNGTVVTLNEENSWEATVENLPKYEGGQLISYTWTEAALPEGYTMTSNETVGTVTTITNSHTPEVTTATVKKVWSDGENQDGKRPESLAVTLSNGTVVTLNETNGWEATVENLPKYEGGQLISYTWTEAALPEGYTLTSNETVGTVTTITNSYTPEVVSVEGSKTWDDWNNAYGKRPNSITIRLMENGQEVASQVVSAEQNWSWSFEDLPKYRVGQVGQEAVYTITEDPVAGYVSNVSGYNATNKLLAVAVQKVDEQTGSPLSGAKFALYEGRLTEPTGTELESWISDGTPKVLTGLTAGQTYTIFETKTPDGYVTMSPYVFSVQESDTPDQLRTFTLKNRHFYRFRKLSSTNNELVYGAQMAIKKDGVIIATWYSNDSNNGWYYVTDDRFVTGVTYTLEELSAPTGYQLAAPIRFKIDKKDGFLIINDVDNNTMDVVMYDQPIPAATPVPESTTTSFRLVKQWEDQDNVLGLRPSSITVHLYRKTNADADYPSVPYLTVAVQSDGSDEWNFTFSDLPRRDGEGRLYTYMAEEEPVDGYVTTYLNNGRTIINSIPQEDIPPTPTPTLPYVTPTPSPLPRHPAGVQFINGQWVYVDEYGVPLGIVPSTGDQTNFALWGAAVLLPLLLAALLMVELRRRKQQAVQQKKN